jgi:hypothetical protein
MQTASRAPKLAMPPGGRIEIPTSEFDPSLAKAVEDLQAELQKLDIGK